MTDFYKRGTQIVYAPPHTEGNLQHPDVEYGFVTADAGEQGVFCRYWAKRHLPVSIDEVDDFLRTKANSELTPRNLLALRGSVPAECVQYALRTYC